MTRLLLADDHMLFRQGLKRLLADADELEVRAEAASGQETLRLAERDDWDVLLLDISFPDISGLDVLRQLRQRGCRQPVLLLSMHPAEDYVAMAARFGATGYIGKDCSSAELIEAIRAVADGRHYLDPEVARRMIFDPVEARHNDAPHLLLSPREYEVFLHLAHGHGITDIAREMGIKTRTVSTFRARLLAKLGLSNNSQLVRYAMELKLV